MIMPIKNKPLEKKERWNFYVTEIDKVEYMIALNKAGKYKAQSAGLRAFMHLYATDDIVRNKINEIIDDYKIFKDSGKPSLM